MRSKNVYAITIVILLLAGCTKTGTGPENGASQETDDFPVLTGSYLGQSPPGTTPARFTPDILLPDGTWWWISPPKFSPDGRRMVFTKYVRGNPDTKHLFCMQQMESGEWSAPQEVPFGSAFGNDCHAAFSTDGSKLFFLSHRDGGPFFYVLVNEGGWSDPVPVNVPNTSGVGNQFSVSRDETLYFEMSNGQADDLFRSRLVNGAYSEPESLGAPINTDAYEEYAPYIDPDDAYLIFASNRPGGFGGNDLYISFQNQDRSWTEPQNMGDTINTDVGGTLPCVSPDGDYLFFIEWKTGDQGFNPYWVDASILTDFNVTAN